MPQKDPGIKGLKTPDFEASSSASEGNTPSELGSLGNQARKLVAEGAHAATEAAGNGAAMAVGGVRAGVESVKKTLLGVGTTIKGGLLTMGGKVGSLLSVTPAAGAAIGAVALSCAIAVPSVAVYDSVVNTNDSVAVKSAMLLDDCRETVQAAQKTYGSGEIQIPETYEGVPTGKGEYENLASVMYTWNSGYGFRAMLEIWNDEGRQMDTVDGVEEAFDRIGSYYIAAISPDGFPTSAGRVATAGDWVTFWFDNGESIDILVGDEKSPHDANYTPWGHKASDSGGYIKTLEFWGEYRGHTDKGVYEMLALNEGWDTVPTRAVSATNHGTSQLFADKQGAGGLGGIAEGSMDLAKRRAIRDAKDDCYSERRNGYDNSSFVNALLSYAYTWKKAGSGASGTYNDGGRYPGTKLYRTVHKNIWGNQNDYPLSCDRSVATAIRWSGIDESVPAGAVAQQYEHYLTSPRWKKVGVWNGSDFSILQPGDVFVKCGGAENGNHTAAYVGQEAILNWNWEGDQLDTRDKPVDGAYCVSGSIHNGQPLAGCAPGASIDGGSGYYIFRCINPEGGSTYASAAEGDPWTSD